MQALWMLLAAFFFASMAVGIKIAGNSFNIFELLFYRGLVGLALTALILRSHKISFKTTFPWMHAWRSLVGILSMGAWFYAIAHLPIATAMTLNYTSGIWIAVFILTKAVWSGNGKKHALLITTILSSFLGVVLVLHPTLNQSHFTAGLIGILSGLGAGLAYLQITAMGKLGEPETRVVFYFAAGTAIAGLIGIIFVGFTPLSKVTWPAVLWVIPLGILASLAQWCMTRALTRGATLLVANLQYAGILFASFYGWMIFDDSLESQSWWGIFLIVSSGVIATALRNKHQAYPVKT